MSKGALSMKLRKRASLSASASSAFLRSVMSTATPPIATIAPVASRIGNFTSKVQGRAVRSGKNTSAVATFPVATTSCSRASTDAAPSDCGQLDRAAPDDLLGGAAEGQLDLVVEQDEPALEVLDRHGHRRIVHEAAHARLALAQRPLGLLAFGDVLGDAADGDDAASGIATGNLTVTDSA